MAQRICLASRHNGTPVFTGPHLPHLFTYGRYDYVGSCAGFIGPVLGCEGGRWDGCRTQTDRCEWPYCPGRSDKGSEPC